MKIISKTMLSFFSLVTLSKAQPAYMNFQLQEDYVPILGYHQIGETTDSITITQEHFDDQVDYLTNVYGCNWITMKKLAEYVENNQKLPTKACVMNFDDATSVQFNKGLCTLNEHKVHATFYVATENVGTSFGYYMTWNEIGQLHTIGHDLGSHAKTHSHLDQLTNEQQEHEVIGSKTDLESRGYEVTSFAYPYGDYNDYTKELVKDNYILGRGISQETTWKDTRAPVVSFNEDHKQLFYYIKPEGLTGEELAERIKYTGWWQFEDNYKLVTGEARAISNADYRGTDTSYAILTITAINTEIETQFLTKYQDAFTIDMLVHNTTNAGGFEVYVDDVLYPVYPFQADDINALYVNTTSGRDYYNFYINIHTMQPGLHTLKIKKIVSTRLYLDKFRIFSSGSQEFTYSKWYPECPPRADGGCGCPTKNPTASPTSAPTMSTISPTESPTMEPTTNPTMSPTMSTVSPTLNPTVNPTASPSLSPTMEPTANPTMSPTMSTVSPTLNPTANPTASPSLAPTMEPTANPTMSPTMSTVSPTLNPTANPTASPSLAPTANPTTAPTMTPTLNPTVNPTVNPTANPTVSPTQNPTINPTLAPTMSTETPTAQPTTEPTVNPTLSPTSSPTMIPTVNPTVSPTTNPTANPTMTPTLNPTVTTNPTQNPTVNPTQNPTVNPTQNPTVNPTVNPTQNPTVNPTVNPSENPTPSPTLSPTILSTEFSLRISGMICDDTNIMKEIISGLLDINEDKISINCLTSNGRRLLDEDVVMDITLLGDFDETMLNSGDFKRDIINKARDNYNMEIEIEGSSSPTRDITDSEPEEDEEFYDKIWFRATMGGLVLLLVICILGWLIVKTGCCKKEPQQEPQQEQDIEMR